MIFNVYQQPNEFATIAEPYLLDNEDIYSLFYGVLQGIKNGRYQEYFMASIIEDGKLLGLLQMTPPHPLNLIVMEELDKGRVIDFVVDELFTRNIPVPSVVGMKSVILTFAEKWKMKTDKDSKILMDQGLYRLDQVIESLQMTTGSWRYSCIEDSPLIEQWYQDFENDTGITKTPIAQIKERVVQFIKDNEVFLWENQGQVVSMMKKSRPSEHGVTVSFVFTPKEQRKKGYARTMVAAGSKELLNSFNFCVLYTDMLNPTSNKIYQEIGYRKIADSIHLEFIEKETN
ncbi:MAG: GNAT family N-acetyltransferase [Paenisporosarcina sp.]